MEIHIVKETVADNGAGSTEYDVIPNAMPSDVQFYTKAFIEQSVITAPVGEQDYKILSIAIIE